MRRFAFRLIIPIWASLMCFSSTTLAKSGCWDGHPNWMLVTQNAISSHLSRIEAIHPEALNKESNLDRSEKYLSKRRDQIIKAKKGLSREYKKGCSRTDDMLFNGVAGLSPSKYLNMSEAADGFLSITNSKLEALKQQRITLRDKRKQAEEQERLQQIAAQQEEEARLKRIEARAKKDRAMSIKALGLPEDVSDAELYKAMQKQKSKQEEERIVAMVDIDRLEQGESLIPVHQILTLLEVEKYVKTRELRKYYVFRVQDKSFSKPEPIYTLDQQIDNGYIFKGYRDTLPIMLITDRQGIERDTIEKLTKIVSFQGVTTYTTVLGASKQAILLKDVWNGKSGYEVTQKLAREAQ